MENSGLMLQSNNNNKSNNEPTKYPGFNSSDHSMYTGGGLMQEYNIGGSGAVVASPTVNCESYKNQIENYQEELNNTIDELFETKQKFSNCSQELQIKVNETATELNQIRSDIAACMTLSSGFKIEADLWASRYAD